MFLCRGNRETHEEVVHDGRDCPLCEALRNMELANGRINDLETELKSMEE